MASTFTAAAIGVTFGNGKHMLALFNGAGSGRVLRVKRVYMLNNQTAAVTGVMTTMAMRRTSAQSGGTSVTPNKHDTANASLPAQVLCAAGATITNTADLELRRWMWSNDEPVTGAATIDEFECVVPMMCVWDSATGDPDLEPIVLREGQGLTIQNQGTTAAGICDLFIEFTDAAS